MAILDYQARPDITVVSAQMSMSFGEKERGNQLNYIVFHALRGLLPREINYED